MTEEDEINTNSIEDFDERDLALNITTSSAISRVNIKCLLIYLPIFWLSGILVLIYWYEWTKKIDVMSDWVSAIILLPLAIFLMYFIFIFASVFFSKLFLILINLIHKPKEGVFLAEKGNKDFDFWCLRIELKKLVVWLIRSCPLPWIDTLAFRWFGVKMDFSSHLPDSWCDVEFVKFGRKVMVGQGAVIMSSMVIGKYLIIKKVIFDDYVVVGGQSVISPGTLVGKDSVTGALSMSSYGQVLEAGWIYFGIPLKKFKPNKYAESRRDLIHKVDVDGETHFHEEHDVNIDEDKKGLI